jgi:hypothetical protein
MDLMNLAFGATGLLGASMLALFLAAIWLFN